MSAVDTERVNVMRSIDARTGGKAISAKKLDND